MENVTTWGQLAFYAVASAVGIILSVSQLFKTMSSSYGGIITALQTHTAALQVQNSSQQTQITSQQEQINQLRVHADNSDRRADDSDRRCDERLKALESKVNGGHYGTS